MAKLEYAELLAELYQERIEHEDEPAVCPYHGLTEWDSTLQMFVCFDCEADYMADQES